MYRLLVLLFVIGSGLWAQAVATPTSITHERSVTVHGRQWIVRYEVPQCSNPLASCIVTVPVTAPLGQSHYSATISVFLDDNVPNSCDEHGLRCLVIGEEIQIGPSFPGQWTEQGCFEDDPAALVEQALGHKHEAAKIISFQGDQRQTSGTNTFPAESYTMKLPPVTDSANAVLQGGGGFVRIPDSQTCIDGQLQVDHNPISPVANGIAIVSVDKCVIGKWVPVKALLQIVQ